MDVLSCTSTQGLPGSEMASLLVKGLDRLHSLFFIVRRHWQEAAALTRTEDADQEYRKDSNAIQWSSRSLAACDSLKLPLYCLGQAQARECLLQISGLGISQGKSQSGRQSEHPVTSQPTFSTEKRGESRWCGWVRSRRKMEKLCSQRGSRGTASQKHLVSYKIKNLGITSTSELQHPGICLKNLNC